MKKILNVSRSFSAIFWESSPHSTALNYFVIELCPPSVFLCSRLLAFLCALQFKYFWIESFTKQGFTFTKKSLYVITNMWLCMWLQNFGVHGICGQMRKNIRHHTFYLVILLTIFPKLVLIWIEWKILAKTNIEVAFKKIHVLTLKLVPAIFYQFFIFSPNGSPSKTVKNAFYFI